MKRRFFTFLSACSLVLSITSLVLWAQGDKKVIDARYGLTPSRTTWWAGSVSSVGPALFLCVIKHEQPHPSNDSPDGFGFSIATGHSILWSWGFATMNQMAQYGHRRVGFGIAHHGGIPVGGDIETVWALMLPQWFVVAAGGIMPALWLLRFRRQRVERRREANGLCPKCGYDLRATPAQCPECGAACKAADPAGVSPAAEIDDLPA